MSWAIVEVMGHRVYAGRIEEVTVAGVPMLRVHVPEHVERRVETDYRSADGTGEGHTLWERDVELRWPAWSVDLGGAALFAVTGCSELTARVAVPASRRGPEGGDRIEGEWRPRNAGALPGQVEEAEVVDALGEE